MRRLQRPLALLFRLFLGGLLLYAVATKWPAPRAVAEDLANYRLVPPALTPTFAVWLLGAETVLGVLLLLGAFAREVALLSALLFAAFAAAVASALLRGLKIDCGCFGAGGSPATGLTLLRDLGFLAVSLLHLGLSFAGVGPPRSD